MTQEENHIKVLQKESAMRSCKTAELHEKIGDMKINLRLLIEFYEQYAHDQYKRGFIDGQLYEATVVFEDETKE